MSLTGSVCLKCINNVSSYEDALKQQSAKLLPKASSQHELFDKSVCNLAWTPVVRNNL